MASKTVLVNLAERKYNIHIGFGLLSRLGALLAEQLPGRRVLVVSDENVAPIFAGEALTALREAGFRSDLVTIPAGEASKNLGRASQVLDFLVDRRADRRTAVVALGGGVVGDLAGFVSAVYARGVPFVQVPTSLLAMVDASVGGKVAVDHPRAKNMIGAFHQPSLVVCDLKCLDALPARQYRCGLAEVVKHGVILDPELFVYLEKHAELVAAREPDAVFTAVARSCEIKAGVVEKDEFETTGLRAVLNYGHTFAHAFETAGGYAGMQHGEAVAVGMMCAARLAELRGMVDGNLRLRQQRLWSKLGLPTALPPELLRHDLVSFMFNDKKAVGDRLRFILPTKLGEVRLVDDVDEDLVDAVLREAPTFGAMLVARRADDPDAATEV
ncbi:MAG: 3-dehydroquinate synthase [Planctomycetia bacterium]